MRKEQYKAKSGEMQFMPVMGMKQLQKITMGDGNLGFCLACGSTQGGTEPDARRYKCESCSKEKVYGIEELMFMGLVKIK